MQEEDWDTCIDLDYGWRLVLVSDIVYFLGASKSRLRRDSGSLPLTSTSDALIIETLLMQTRGEKKRKLCLDLGAAEFLDFTEVDIVEAVKASTSGLGAHAVICTANGEKAYEQSTQMLRRLGTLVCVGIPNVPFKLPVTPFDMIVKGKSRNILYIASCLVLITSS